MRDDDTTIQALDSFTRAFDVPHVTLASKNFVPKLFQMTGRGQTGNTFQLMPHIEKAVFDYMYFNNWTSAVVFYDDDIGKLEKKRKLMKRMSDSIDCFWNS